MNRPQLRRTAHSGGPQILHPLMGCSLATLLRVAIDNGFVGSRGVLPIVVAFAAATLRWPFSTLEKIVTDARLRAVPQAAPPVFIVGHWRSGTTHLFNTLSRGAGFCYLTPVATALPWDSSGLARVFRALIERTLPENRFVDRVPVQPDSPQEDEVALANIISISFYHGLYFPRKFEENFNRGVFFDGCGSDEVDRWKRAFTYLTNKHSLIGGGAQMLIKNPVYTARVALLRAMWPNAKFIHVYRNPFSVFESTRRFYKILFERFALQNFEHVSIDDFILRSYPRMMRKLLNESAGLPEKDFVEIRFESFEATPLAEIRRIYDILELDGLDEAVPRFKSYLDSVRGYRKNSYGSSPERRELVRQHWKPFIDRWGYRTA